MSLAIEILDLEWKYEHRKHFALKKVSLEIEENSFIGIVGTNEQGKTTLISSINGLIPHSYNGVYRGEVRVFDSVVRDMDALELALQVGFVFSDPEAQFTAMTVEEELAFGLENAGIPLSEIGDRLHWAADLTMTENLLDKSPYDVSGGQKQRVAIASVLAMNPPIIIMDEPTSMIDPLGKTLIFDILRKLKEGGEHTLIVVEHNVEQLAPLADKMLLMENGEIRKYEPAAAFFSDPGFLESRGVFVPEATAFAQWLISQGHVPAESRLPLNLQEGIEIAHLALEGR